MPRRPNIVFVLTDDQGYGDLGCHGNRVIRTPSLDRFHREAVRFTDYHVGSTCAPTRAGLLTGHYCNSAGVWHTNRRTLAVARTTSGPSPTRSPVPATAPGTSASGTSETARPTAPTSAALPNRSTTRGGGIGNTGDAWGNDYFDDTYFNNGVPTPFEGYCTDVFFREGRRFIEENGDRPLLLLHRHQRAPRAAERRAALRRGSIPGLHPRTRSGPASTA